MVFSEFGVKSSAFLSAEEDIKLKNYYKGVLIINFLFNLNNPEGDAILTLAQEP